MGGDEFVVVPPAGTRPAQAAELAERIVETLRAPYTLPDTGEMLLCPVSVGVAATHRRSVGLIDLLREADIALYRVELVLIVRFRRFTVSRSTAAGPSR